MYGIFARDDKNIKNLGIVRRFYRHTIEELITRNRMFQSKCVQFDEKVKTITRNEERSR